MAEIRFEDITKKFGDKIILDRLNLSIEDGSFTVMIGPSGCGKTTLLRIIAGIGPQTSGKVYLDGEDISGLPPAKRNVAMVFQNYAIYPTMTVQENIEFGLKNNKVPKEERERLVKEISEIVGIGDLLNRKPSTLSGGQRQRAACARAIITSPALVLADEPTGALDSKNSKILMKTFELMNESLGSTILAVTHDAVVGSYAGRVLFLKDGKIWNELVRGDRDRREMYAEILSVTAALGGDADVF
mgnify:CR=1 FL=1